LPRDEPERTADCGVIFGNASAGRESRVGVGVHSSVVALRGARGISGTCSGGGMGCVRGKSRGRAGVARNGEEECGRGEVANGTAGSPRLTGGRCSGGGEPGTG